MTNHPDYPRNLIKAVFGEERPIDIARLPIWLSHLSDREERVIEQRYALGMTLEEVGKEFAVTRERIRQLEAKALKKLSYPAYCEGIFLIRAEEYEKLKAESDARYAALLSKYSALRKHTEALHEAIKSELPEFKQIFQVMSDGVLDDGRIGLPDIPIEKLELSVRAYNCLKRAGIGGVTDLASKSLHEMQQVRNLGNHCISEISEALKKLGYSPDY